MTKVMVDTNVLVYAYDNQSAFYQRAVTFLNNPTVDFYVSTKNIAEFFAVLTKMNQPISNIFQFYTGIQYNTTILYPNANSLAIFEGLIQKYTPRGNQFYDFEVASIAIANQITEIATFNIKDFVGVTEISIFPL